MVGKIRVCRVSSYRNVVISQGIREKRRVRAHLFEVKFKLERRIDQN
jgi:hypothetical protein